MKIATITPTRGDRPQFVEHAKYLMSQQTYKGFESFFIDYEPLNDDMDLTDRVKIGLEWCKVKGIEYAFLWEDDDYYTPDYIESIVNEINETNADFIGCERTIYYNILLGKYCVMNHFGRSSLFNTTIKVNALNGFDWSNDFLDMKIWLYATNYSFTGFNNIGIKHGIGKCGGIGHTYEKMFDSHDPNGMFLRNSVDNKSFKFYGTFGAD